MGFHVAGRNPNGLAKSSGGFTVLPLLRKCRTQIAMSLGIAGFELDRLAILGDRFVQLAGLCQRVSQVHLGERIVWVQPLRRREFLVRLLDLPLKPQRTAQPRMSRSVVAIEPDRLAKRGDGIVQLVLRLEREAQIRMIVGLVKA